MGDYGFRSEVEPRIDKSEQFILREVVAKAENQTGRCDHLSRRKRSQPKTSAALDFALGTMYYQLGRLTPIRTDLRTSIEQVPLFFTGP
jgi:hypothetical protein